MPSEAQKYCDYARECVRLAGHADSAEVRDKLLDLARVWMQTAVNEDEGARPSVAGHAARTTLIDWQKRRPRRRITPKPGT
jgi:hypothetical protein